MTHHRMFQRIRDTKFPLSVALALMLALGCAMGFGTSVWADAAPPAKPPGSNISPSNGTMVQMVAENVLLWVYSLGNDVSVNADFAMRNLGTEREVLAVRFPMENPNGYGDGFGRHTQVKNFSVRVDDDPIPFKVIEESYMGDDDPIPWATFDVEFPPNEDVIISVSYFTDLYGHQDRALLEYVLGTGAGWYGPIGSAVITLRLPYAASPTNVFSVYVGHSGLGPTFVGNEVRWQAQSYEPDPYDQFMASIIWPSNWAEILELEARVGEAPSDIKAVSALVEAYRKMSVHKGVIMHKNLFGLSENILLQALALKPSSPDLMAEIAVGKWWQWLYGLGDGSGDLTQVQDIESILMIVLKDDPHNQKALDLMDEMRTMLGYFELPDEASAADLPTHTPTPEVKKQITPTNLPEEDDLKKPFPATSAPNPTTTKISSTPTFSPHPTETKIAPSPTFSPHLTLQPEPSHEPPKNSFWIGFIAVGIASLGAGASIGYFAAKR